MSQDWHRERWNYLHADDIDIWRRYVCIDVFKFRHICHLLVEADDIMWCLGVVSLQNAGVLFVHLLWRQLKLVDWLHGDLQQQILMRIKRENIKCGLNRKNELSYNHMIATTFHDELMQYLWQNNNSPHQVSCLLVRLISNWSFTSIK